MKFQRFNFSLRLQLKSGIKRDTRAGRRETDDRLPAIIAGIKGADPDITLQAICERLESMRERTPRGRTRWRPSSVKMLLERAERLGMI